MLTAGNNSTCVVCHAVSANGATLTTQSGANYSQTVEYNLSNLATTTMAPADGRFAWAALSPDGTYLFSNAGTPLGGTTSVASGLFTVPGGSSIAASGLPTIDATTPSFSPDAAHVAFNFYSGTASGKTGDQASLASIDFAPATKSFSNFQVLATPGTAGVGASANKVYYPSYLPAGNQLVWELETVYNGRDTAGTRSQCDQAGPVACQNDGTHAELWWTDVSTKTSAKLTNLNGGSYLPMHATANNPSGDNQLNYEPTVNPQVTGGYAWVVFTSRRLYGNVATVNPFWSDPRYEDISAQPTTKKLWVAAVKPGAAPGADPSHPAFYLPAQELLAGNSRGYFVQNQCEAAGAPTAANLCDSDLDCCPAASGQPPVVCALDAPPATTKHCTQSPTNSCSANGAACAMSSQCCAYPASVCAQNVCTPATTYSYSPTSFTQDYTASCPSGTRPSWVDVGVEAQTPSGGGTYSSVKMTAQVAGAMGNFSPSTPVNVGTLAGPPVNQAANWNNFDLTGPLAMIGPIADLQPRIRITFTLQPSTDTAAAPTLVNWRVRFDCSASE